MKVYIVFKGSSYPYANGDIIGVFCAEEDAENMRISLKNDEAFIEEHLVIE
jgi:hypothetical protein